MGRKTLHLFMAVIAFSTSFSEITFFFPSKSDRDYQTKSKQTHIFKLSQTLFNKFPFYVREFVFFHSLKVYFDFPVISELNAVTRP